MLGKRLINSNDAAGGCASDEVDILGDGSGVALYQLNWDGSDMSGNYDGVATDVSFVNGKIDSAGSFNGSSSVINVPSTPLDLTTDFSVSGWLNQESSATNLYLFACTDTNNDIIHFDFNLQSSANRFEMVYNDIAYYPTLTYQSGWHHYAVTLSGTSFKIYRNGSLFNTQSVTVASASGSRQTIGSRQRQNYNSFGKGSIDQVRIFNKALSASEVTTLYNETACVKTCTTDTPQLVSDCIAYYKLDGNADDSNGTATVYDGTPTNVSWTQGRFGSAAGFNGSSSGVNTPVSFLNAKVTSSVSLWIKYTDTSAYKTIFQDWSSNNNWNHNIIANQPSTGNLRFFSAYGGASGHKVFETSGLTLNDGNWHHIVSVVDLNTNTLTGYVDGVSVGSVTVSTNSWTGVTQNANIGNENSSSNFFNGSIDQVRIYDRAITSTEVTTLYNEVACPSGLNFNTVLYTGNGGTQNVGGVEFQPDLVWVKSRSDAYGHILTDSVRGAGTTSNSKILNTNNTNEEGWASYIYGYLSSFDSNGFTVTTGSTGAEHTNFNGDNYVAWCWKAGGDAVTIPQGTVGNTIASDVSANVDAGFSIVKYTGEDATRTIGHGLSSAPEMMIIKNLTDGTRDWSVYHKDTGNTDVLRFNQTDAASSNSVFWNNTSPTSTLFTVGNSSITGSSDDFIAYCFHSVAGYQKVGSYSGGTSGVQVTTGFKPRFVLLKNTTTSADSWCIFDTIRSGETKQDDILFANASNAESVNNANVYINVNSTGFTVANTFSISNGSGNTYIYLAIA